MKDLCAIAFSLILPILGGIKQVLFGGFGARIALNGWVVLAVQLLLTLGHAGGSVFGGALLLAALVFTQAASALVVSMCGSANSFEPNAKKSLSRPGLMVSMVLSALLVTLVFGGLLLGLIGVFTPIKAFWSLILYSVLIAQLNAHIIYRILREKGLIG